MRSSFGLRTFFNVHFLLMATGVVCDGGGVPKFMRTGGIGKYILLFMGICICCDGRSGLWFAAVLLRFFR